MNFAFESTFKFILKSITRLSLQVRLALLMIGFNITLAICAVYIYLSNAILPATIGSRYYGHYYVATLKVFAIVLIITGGYALLVLLNHFILLPGLRRYSSLRIRSSLKQ